MRKRNRFRHKKMRSRHASKNIIYMEKTNRSYSEKNPCKFAFGFSLSCVSIRSKDLTLNSRAQQSSTRQCLDHRKLDRANNLKKATRYCYDAHRQNNNKAETSRALSESFKCQRIISQSIPRRNVYLALTILLPKVPREFEPRYELVKPAPLREIKSPSTSSIVLYTP